MHWSTPLTYRLHDYIAANDAEAARAPAPVTGWPLVALARLDRGGARGLIADLLLAGIHSRQAAFIAAGYVDLECPDAFLHALGVRVEGLEGVGVALRTNNARSVIAAVFGVRPEQVPSGYLRALAKIEEIGAEQPGLYAFEDPTTYRILWDIFVHDGSGQRANALRYTPRLRSSTIRAVMCLDPVLLWPEILAVTGSPRRVTAANNLLSLIRACHSSVSEEDLVSAMRDSLKDGGTIETFARRALERADRLPVVLPKAEGIRVPETAADYRDLGARLQNCAAEKLSEVALGLLAIVEITYRAADGTEQALAATLTPTADGRWIVSEVLGPRNRRVPSDVLRPVLRRLQALGAIVPGPAIDSHFSADLADLLGIFRNSLICDGLHPEADSEDDEVLEALALAEEAA
jgi:hypothetical protein